MTSNLQLISEECLHDAIIIEPISEVHSVNIMDLLTSCWITVIAHLDRVAIVTPCSAFGLSSIY